MSTDTRNAPCISSLSLTSPLTPQQNPFVPCLRFHVMRLGLYVIAPHLRLDA